MLKKKKNINNRVYLPEELLIQILLKLTVRDLVRFKRVCKSWLFLINSPSFIDQHLEVSKKNNQCFILNCKDITSMEQSISIVSYQTLQVFETHQVVLSNILKTGSQRLHIVGSCNGILCLTTHPETLVVLLWNPATRQTKKIINFTNCGGQTDHKTCSDNIGFGFDAKTNDYKVVSISETPFPFEVKVYSLKTGTWKICSSCSKDENLVITCIAPWGVCCGGMYSWMALTKEKGKIVTEEIMIISFDMSNEELVSTPLPSDVTIRGNYYPTLALGGSFALVYRINGVETSVWKLGEYGVKESWTRLFTFGSASHEWPFGLLNYSGKSFLVIRTREEEDQLDLFDPSTKQRNSLPISKKGTMLLRIESNFAESLVPISRNKEEIINESIVFKVD